mmetsp:Transcript_4302/g.9886  ORF Transcript_4302/g.9886 Transcript_4302/m.9886 type:complete len:86 (+) Transcript_4302:1240-1497(+)
MPMVQESIHQVKSPNLPTWLKTMQLHYSCRLNSRSLQQKQLFLLKSSHLYESGILGAKKALADSDGVEMPRRALLESNCRKAWNK